MTTAHTDEPSSTGVSGADTLDWTRLEGIVAVGALLATFLWFLGMPTGMAIGVGFGVVLLLDFLRSLLCNGTRPDRPDLTARDVRE
jgi:hypothetical protein